MQAEYKGQVHIKILQEIYKRALDIVNKGDLESLFNGVDKVEKAHLKTVVDNFERGRGHGLAAVRRFVNQWNGKLSIRSGTAKLSIIPAWSRGKEKELNLSYFPGSQINILLPEI